MRRPLDESSGPGICLLGTKTIALRLLEKLTASGLPPSQLVTWDDSGDVRSRVVDLEAACRRLAIPVVVARRAADAYAAIRDAAPAVVLVAGWYRLIPDQVLESVPGGFVGAHYSPLPRYRGSAPVVWQLMSGESDIGFSLFRLSSEMDEGDLAGGGFVPAGTGYVGEVLDRLDEAALGEFVRIAPALADGTHVLRPQPDVRPSYASMRSPADGRIDWTRSATEVVRAVRAQSRPYPGAWTVHGSSEIRIWRASVENEADYRGVPGRVVRFVGELPVVACGENSGVLIEEFDDAQLGLASKLG